MNSIDINGEIAAIVAQAEVSLKNLIARMAMMVGGKIELEIEDGVKAVINGATVMVNGQVAKGVAELVKIADAVKNQPGIAFAKVEAEIVQAVEAEAPKVEADLRAAVAEVKDYLK